MKKIIIFIIVGVLLVISVVFVIKKPKIQLKTVIEASKTIKIGENVLNVEMADTNTKRVQGLSGKVGLRENEGMLFVFDTEGYYGIWMKDMNFPIDIAWLDKNKKIIYIKNAVGPETYPKVFYAFETDAPVLNLYVLETSAGFLAENNIKIGDFVAF